MQVRAIMSFPVIGVTAEATLEEAAALMMDRGFTTLPVFTGAGRLIGLLTEAELGRARFVPDMRKPPEPCVEVTTEGIVRRVAQVMRAPAPVIPANADLAELAAVMVDSRQRCLPVVDGSRVVGMASWRDLLSRLLTERPAVEFRDDLGHLDSTSFGDRL
jgi:CBS domain-containing protein